MPESLVRFWLGLAAAGSVAATFQVVFWPRWPSASLPSTANLAVDGYTLSPEAGSPAERTSDLAISPTVRYRMVSNGSRPEQASPSPCSWPCSPLAGSEAFSWQPPQRSGPPGT